MHNPQLLDGVHRGEVEEICKSNGPIRLIPIAFPVRGHEHRRRFWELLRQLPEKYRMNTEDDAAHNYYL